VAEQLFQVKPPLVAGPVERAARLPPPPLRERALRSTTPQAISRSLEPGVYRVLQTTVEIKFGDGANVMVSRAYRR